MLRKCSRFKSEGGEFADAGTRRHKALGSLLSFWSGTPKPTHEQYEAKRKELLLDFDDEEADGIAWAADYIAVKARSDFPLVIERKMQWLRPDFTCAEGTPDYWTGPELFDFKWRPRDYSAQMADYCLAIMQEGNFDRVTVHILFGAMQRAQVVTFERAEAEAIVFDALESPAKRPDPVPNEYCGWCSDCIRCKPYLDLAQAVTKGYAEVPALKEWHPSKIETGEEFADALRAARLVKKWCASVEHHCKEAATKRGLSLPGFEQCVKKGKQYIADAARAFGLLGIAQEIFLKCVEVRLLKSPKYPDKLGIVNSYASMHGMKVAPAKRELLAKLEPVLKSTKDSVILKAVDQETEEEETEE